MFNCKGAAMKCPVIKSTKEDMVDNTSAAAAESKVLHLKDSPNKEPVLIKAVDLPAGVTTVLFSIEKNTSAGHNKENSDGRDRAGSPDQHLEDSGYLSLQNSHVGHGDEDDCIAGIHQERTASSHISPLKCEGRTRLSFPGSLVVSTPVDRHRRSTAAWSSTPTNQHLGPNLPILKFEQAVCEELSKSYKKNKRYDWSVISKIAEEHVLDRVIGRQIGLDHVDVFTALLSRNMKTILTKILALLGDLDLISCKKVSKTWRKIIHEDSAAMRRCRQAEQALRESMSSQRPLASGLTRDVATSRVVLSCMQALASSNTPASSHSSSTQSCRNARHIAGFQKSCTANTQHTRFNQYVQVASTLKRDESLRPCRRCGSPAIHSAQVQRAKCTRSSCLFDFCTCCQEAFHGSTPCRTAASQPHFTASKATTIIPGGTRSKRNIRRL